MMKKIEAFASVFFFLFLVGCLAVCCSADLPYIMSVREMTEKADVILVGEVESVLHCPASFEDIPHMHRQVIISVEKYLKNSQESAKVTVIARGATVGNTTMWVEDQPDFEESERVLLFLSDDPGFLKENPHGYFQVLGECQGKFTIDGNNAVSELGLEVEDGEVVGSVKFTLYPKKQTSNLYLLFFAALICIMLVVIYYKRYL